MYSTVLQFPQLPTSPALLSQLHYTADAVKCSAVECTALHDTALSSGGLILIRVYGVAGTRAISEPTYRQLLQPPLPGVPYYQPLPV